MNNCWQARTIGAQAIARSSPGIRISLHQCARFLWFLLEFVTTGQVMRSGKLSNS
jgi:hypothetical protein